MGKEKLTVDVGSRVGPVSNQDSGIGTLRGATRREIPRSAKKNAALGMTPQRCREEKRCPRDDAAMMSRRKTLRSG
jgi:hypothetical protein